MALTREQARLLDQRAMKEYGIPGIILMENAGRSMAELLLSLGALGPVVLCCGKGNNGGDGFVIARHLDMADIPVQILTFAEEKELAPDAAINYRICVRSGLPIHQVRIAPLEMDRLTTELNQAAWIVDALFGSGLQGAIKSPFDQVIQCINNSPALVFSVDIPSGMDANTGISCGSCVKANHTATVVAPKIGFAFPKALPLLGHVHDIGMGAPRKLLAEMGLG